MKRSIVVTASTLTIGLTVLGLGSSVAAGSEPAGGGGAPSTADAWRAGGAIDLDGRAFVATAVEGRDLVEGSEIRLGFDGDGLGVSGGCNLMGAGWMIALDRLVVGDVTSTMMACAPDLMEQDSWVSSFLQSAPNVDLAGDTLTLSGPSATITLVDEQAVEPDVPLEGTTWLVESLLDGDAASSVPAGVRTPTITLDGGGLGIDAGCNVGAADAAVGDGQLTIQPPIMTMMACDQPVMDVERHVLDVLVGSPTYEIDGDRLTLRQGDLGLVLTAG